MQSIVQYIPEHPEAIDILRQKGFLYNLDPGSEGITTFNRVRKLADKFHVVGITRNLILALLANSGGFPLDRGVNTKDAQITSFCYINVDRFKRAVFMAILAGQLQARSPQLLISDELVEIGNSIKNMPANRERRRSSGGKNSNHIPSSQMLLPFEIL